MAIISGIIGVDVIGAFVIGEPLPIPPTLEDVLPNGTPRYVGFFTSYPTSANGTGGVESTIPRVAVSSWDTSGIRRYNLERLDFEVPSPQAIVGLGVWDSASGGELLAFEPVQLEVGSPVTIALDVDDTLAILEGDLVLGFVLCESIVTSHSEDYCDTLPQLFPQGLAWRMKPGGLMRQLFCALSYEYSRIEIRGRDVINESDPRTTVELLEDWERNLNIPGECQELAPTTAGRQAAVTAKYTQKNGPNPAYFLQLAEEYGYTGTVITRSLGSPFLCTSRCIDALYSGAWVWTFGIQTNESLSSDDSFDCMVNQMVPNHGYVHIVHGSEIPTSGLVFHVDSLRDDSWDGADLVELVETETATLNSVTAEADEDLAFDGDASSAVFAVNAAWDDIFDGGGAVTVVIEPASDGESDSGFIVTSRESGEANGWSVYTANESGDEVDVRLHRHHASTDGIWSVTVNLSEKSIITFVYDDGDVGNNPWAMVNGVATEPTEISTPVGAPASDAGNQLVIGNTVAGDRGFDGVLNAVLLYNEALGQLAVESIHSAYTGRTT